MESEARSSGYMYKWRQSLPVTWSFDNRYAVCDFL